MGIKGIILAGGHGSRLYPLTIGTSKQLLPVYDKPMIYYPLSVFLRAGILEILIISTKSDLPRYKRLLGNGSNFGVNISYSIQKKPNGIAESFLIGSDFIGNDNVCLILGDNIFHGENLDKYIFSAKNNLDKGKSTIFGVRVDNPENFGVIDLDDKNNILSIIEKPLNPKSNLIVSGLYFYTNEVVEVSKSLEPSDRGEKEITDINNHFMAKKKLKLNILNDDISWIDTGTYTSLIKASKFFEDYEKLHKKKASCVEEIAYRMGYISEKKLSKIAKSMSNSDYGLYLKNILKRNEIKKN